MHTALSDFITAVREAHRLRREAPARLRAAQEAAPLLAAETEAIMNARAPRARTVPNFVIACAHDEHGSAVDSETVQRIRESMAAIDPNLDGDAQAKEFGRLMTAPRFLFEGS